MGDPVIRKHKHKHKQKKTKVAPTRPTVLASEDNPIDQIFASKTKGKQKESALKATSDSKCPTPPDSSKNPVGLKSKKRPPPETVFDPSAVIPSKKRAKVEMRSRSNASKAKDGAKVITEDLERFKDSRQSGSSEYLPYNVYYISN
jgi:hypothetical protein